MKILHLTTIAICAGTHTAMAIRPTSASDLSPRNEGYLGIRDARQSGFSKRSILDATIIAQALHRRAGLVRRSGRGEGEPAAQPQGGAPTGDVEVASGRRPADDGVTMERTKSGTLTIGGVPAELPPGVKVQPGEHGALTTKPAENRVKLEPIPGTPHWQTPEGLKVHAPERNSNWEKVKDKLAPPTIERTNSGRMKQNNVAPNWVNNYVKPIHKFGRQCLTTACLGLLTTNQVHAVGAASTFVGKQLAAAGAAGLGGLTTMEGIPPASKAASKLGSGLKKLRAIGGVKKPARQGPR